MLVVFDLDDTLIETSKCLTPVVLMRAFETLQEAGLGARRDAFEDLFAINQRSLSSKAALATFLSKYSDFQKFLEIGLKSLSEPLPSLDAIELVPEALKILDDLAQLHVLALVTYGEESFQIEKMEKAGIQPARFSKLVVTHNSSKKRDYQAILSDLKIPPKEALVCGDRIPFDLTPAKELGMVTVHFRNGRGMYHLKPEEDVDMTINCLNELSEVLAHHEA